MSKEDTTMSMSNMSDNKVSTDAPVEEKEQVGFAIEKIYVKDASVELPHAPEVFKDRTQPQMNVELANEHKNLEDGVYEVTLKVTVTSKVGDKTMFLIDVTQAGIFQIRNVPESNLERILAIACPNIIFPYARESISDLMLRAGFQPLLLNPINFEAVFEQQQQQGKSSV